MRQIEDPADVSSGRQVSVVSRRGFLATAGLAVAAASLRPRHALADDATEGVVAMMRRQAATTKITVKSLRGNISVLIGSGGNIAVLNGKEGKFLVDAGLTGSRPQIAEALTSIGSEPVRYLANTHWHFDHTDGNEWLHAAGAVILAHENTRKRLATSTRVEDWAFTFAPSPAGALPAIDFTTGVTLHLNGTAAVVESYGPCHTDTDISIAFPDADVIHLGDTWWNGHYPFIDYSTGGSINGMIRAAETSLAKGSSKTIFIPGHGPVGDRSQLTEYRDLLMTARDKISALKKEGKSIDEVIAAKPTAAYDARWGGFVIPPSHFIRLVYAGV